MTERLIFAGAAALLLLAVAGVAYAVHRSIERDRALDAASYARDTEPEPQPATDPLDAKWAAFWAQRDLDYRCSTLPGRLADAADVRTWERDHGARTALAFADQASTQRGAWDDWLNAHLQVLGFASAAAVSAAMEAQVRETIERMERDVQRTDIECTATGSWTDDDARQLREYEASLPVVTA